PHSVSERTDRSNRPQRFPPLHGGRYIQCIVGVLEAHASNPGDTHPKTNCSGYAKCPAADAKKQKGHNLKDCDPLILVGAVGFELTTLCSQSRCATRLRYAPKT